LNQLAIRQLKVIKEIGTDVIRKLENKDEKRFGSGEVY